MKTVALAQVEAMDNPHGVDARKLSDSEHAQVVHITLAPGEALRRHVTPVDVCFYVLAGRPAVEVGDDTERVGPDTLVESPAGVPHRVANDDADDAARFLVIKAPRPAERRTRVTEV
jgi:quercetin dioxygenase-like cupin family protein